MINRKRLTGWPVRTLLIMVAVILGLSGCAFALGEEQALPTLAPTLDAAAGLPGGSPEESAVEAVDIPKDAVASTDAGAPASPAAEDAASTEGPPPVAGTPTHTLTPWPSNTPTPGPSPTPTRTPTRTRIPTRTLAPTRTPTITLTPTITFTPTPPAPDISLSRPGLMSKVVSPIQLELVALTGEGGIVRIELIGEDGRLIAGQNLQYGSTANRGVWASPELPFEIDAAAETARLQVSTEDEFGRLTARSSVDLILLSVGRNEIYPPSVTQDPYLMRRPRHRDTIRGGRLLFQGLARPLNDSPVIVELIGEDNRVLASEVVSVPQPTGDLSHTPFSVELLYHVQESTPARLVLRQEGSRIPGTVALTSWLVTLEP